MRMFLRPLPAPVVVTILALAVILPAHAGSEWPQERVMQAAFDVSSGGTLRVDVPDADLELERGAADRVEIEVFLGSRDMERARQHFESMNYRADGNEREVTLKADRARSRWSWRDWGGYSITAKIRVPEAFNLDLHTSDGDISVEQVQGTLQVKTSDGDVDVGGAEGSQVSIVTSDGDVSVGDLRAPSIRIASSDGDIRATDLDGDEIELRSSDGDIWVGAVSGALDAATGDGDIQVRIDRFAETSLQSGDGDITVQAPSTLQADLDLSGEDVVLGSPVRLDGFRDDRKARGTINGGGPLLRATTRDGTITFSVADDG